MSGASDSNNRSPLKTYVPEVAVRSAQIRQLYSQVRIGLLGSVLAALALAAVLWQVVPFQRVIVWLVAFLAIQIPRHVLLQRFHRTEPQGAEALWWGKRFLLGSVATALLLGVSAILLFPSESFVHQCLLGCILAGFAASTAVAHAPLTECYVSSVLLTLLPLLGRFLHQSGESGAVLAAVGFVFAGALLSIGNSMHKMIVSSIRLRFERDEMVRNLQQAQETLGALVTERTAELRLKNEDLSREVSERKRTEEALGLETSRFKTLAENLPLGLVSMSEDGSFHYVNRKFRELFHYDLDDVPDGRRWLHLAYPDPEYRHLVISCWREDLEKAKPGELRPRTFAVICKDGRKKTVHFRTVQLETGEHLMTCEDITDRVLAEDQLKQEREFTEAILRSVPGLLYLFDESGSIYRWNKQLEDLTGYSAEEVRRMHVLDWFGGHEPDTTLIAQRVQDVLAKGSASAEANLITKDGRAVPFYLTAVRLTIAGKHYFTGIGIDITERKRAEAHIRLNEARLQSLYDISQYKAETIQDLLDFTLNEAVKLTESQVGYIYFYDEDKKLFELNTWSREVMKECEVAEPQTLCELDKTGIWGEAVRQGNPVVVNDFQAQNPLRKGYPDGHVELHNFMTLPVSWRERIVAVVGVANKRSDYDESDVRQLALLMDSAWRIAEAKRSELAQRRSATALEYAAEGVVITDTDGTIQYVNPSLERISGYSRDELLGNNPRVFKSGLQDEAFYQQLWQTIKAGGVWSGRFINKRKDGTLYTEDATISPVREASGRITNFVATKRDVTDQLALSKQLFHAQKMEAIGTLAGGIAHDFNNLLQAILGCTDLLLMQKGANDPDRKRLEVIQSAVRDGADLVSRILAFSRKTQLRPHPIDLNEEIRRAEKLLRRTLPRMIEIDLVLADDLRGIEADPTQIEQVILNLGVNAGHAMPDGGRLVIETSNVSLSDEYARTHLEPRPGKYVLMTVSDTGIGMEADVLERVFEPFFTTKTNGEGTGLGLSMVHGIVSQHGGYIRCYSEPGRGTSFKIYFPVSASELIADMRETREMPAFGTEAILLVDDDDRVREIARQTLERAGYRAISARSGEEALAMYAAYRDEISLVILDLIMPGMGGKRCLEELLLIDPDAKVLVASGYSPNGLAQDEEDRGAKGFIGKPYDAKDILIAVRKVLDSGHL